MMKWQYRGQRVMGGFSSGPHVELADLSEAIFLFLTLVFCSSAPPLVGHNPDADGNPTVRL